MTSSIPTTYQDKAQKLLEPAVGDTDLILLVKEVVQGSKSVDDVKTFLDDRPAGINIPDQDNRKTPLHYACSPLTRKYQCRDNLIEVLLDFGANSFLTDNTGTPAILSSPDPRDREAAISTFLRYRMEKEPDVESVAPMGASRLMKRSEGDRGYGKFSSVATHCLFYLYKGALYLWDTVDDVEHVIYQPRHANPEIAKTEGKLQSHLRKKSFVAHGGQDDTYDFQDEEILTEALKKLEGRVPLVTHFTVCSGLDAEQSTLIPTKNGGVSEWIITDTGVMIQVEMNSKGIVLARSGESGFFGGMGRRKSHVCGAAATYAQGTSPKIRIHHNTALRFHKHTEESGEVASNTCIAVDGLRGVIAYVVASEPPPTEAASPKSAKLLASINSEYARKLSDTTATERRDSLAEASKSVHFTSTTGVDGDKPFATPSTSFLGNRPPAIIGTPSPTATPKEAGKTPTHLFTSSPQTDGHLAVEGGGAVPQSGEGRSPRKRAVSIEEHPLSHTGSVHFDDSSKNQPVFLGGMAGPLQHSVTENMDSMMDSSLGDSSGKRSPSPNTATRKNAPFGIFKNEEDDAPSTRHLVFRVIHTDMVPKGGLNDALKQLTRTYNPATGNGGDHFSQCRISEFKIPYPEDEDLDQEASVLSGVSTRSKKGGAGTSKQLAKKMKIIPPDPISVQQLGATKFILFTKTGPVIAETETAPAKFHLIKTNPQGDITFGTAKAANQTGRLRTVLKRCFFVEVSEVVELYELNLDTFEAVSIFRTAGDRQDPHRILPIFHPTEEALCLLYQSIKRQEVCKLDLNTLRFKSVCRLPKPSSLRFYATTAGQQTLSELYFTWTKNGQQLLRYNVSMHVMSIYSWEEMSTTGDQKYINCTFVRNPVTIDVRHERQVKDDPKIEKVKGDTCTWLVMQSIGLAAHQAKLREDKSPFAALSTGAASLPEALRNKLTGGNSSSEGNAAALITIDPASPLSGRTSPTLSDQGSAGDESQAAAVPNQQQEETLAEKLLADHFYAATKAFGIQKKPGKVPRRACTWAAAFPVPLDAVRCGLKLLRSTMDKIQWPDDILEAEPEFNEKKMPYRSKSHFDKKHPSALSELDEKTPWESRGPRVRFIIVSGNLNDDQPYLTREVDKIISPATDGVVAVDGPVMKVVKPLISFAAPCPIAETKIGRVAVMVPQELDERLIK